MTTLNDDLAAEVRRAERTRRVRSYMADLRARVRDLGRDESRALQDAHRGPGYTWRGWWYPRALVLGLLWLAILALLGLLAVGIFTHPTLGA